MAPLDLAFINLRTGPDKAADELVLQYLGAALIAEWEALPEAAKGAIRNRLAKVAGDIKPTVQLEQQVKSLFRHNQRSF
jgi:hypothetical protein